MRSQNVGKNYQPSVDTACIRNNPQQKVKLGRFVKEHTHIHTCTHTYTHTENTHHHHYNIHKMHTHKNDNRGVKKNC